MTDTSCSFCGFPKDAVRVLLVGKDACICDGCLFLMAEMFSDVSNKPRGTVVTLAAAGGHFSVTGRLPARKPPSEGDGDEGEL